MERRKTRQVALDVRYEDGHPRLRTLAGEELEGLGLAGSGRARDEPVTVEHRQGDLDARVPETGDEEMAEAGFWRGGF